MVTLYDPTIGRIRHLAMEVVLFFMVRRTCSHLFDSPSSNLIREVAPRSGGLASDILEVAPLSCVDTQVSIHGCQRWRKWVLWRSRQSRMGVATAHHFAKAERKALRVTSFSGATTSLDSAAGHSLSW